LAEAFRRSYSDLCSMAVSAIACRMVVLLFLLSVRVFADLPQHRQCLRQPGVQYPSGFFGDCPSESSYPSTPEPVGSQVDLWWYMWHDDVGNSYGYGPYSSATMQLLYKSRVLTANTLVVHNSHNHFHPLWTLFPHVDVAFTLPPIDDDASASRMMRHKMWLGQEGVGNQPGTAVMVQEDILRNAADLVHEQRARESEDERARLAEEQEETTVTNKMSRSQRASQVAAMMASAKKAADERRRIEKEEEEELSQIEARRARRASEVAAMKASAKNAADERKRIEEEEEEELAQIEARRARRASEVAAMKASAKKAADERRRMEEEEENGQSQIEARRARRASEVAAMKASAKKAAEERKRMEEEEENEQVQFEARRARRASEVESMKASAKKAADARARQSELAAKASKAKPANQVFNPTNEWQEIPDGVLLPGGLEYRINFETRKKHCRLLQRS